METPGGIEAKHISSIATCLCLTTVCIVLYESIAPHRRRALHVAGEMQFSVLRLRLCETAPERYCSHEALLIPTSDQYIVPHLHSRTQDITDYGLGHATKFD